jgi:hypothetical protein
MRKLTTNDIVDLRAYERERNEFRDHIIEMKQRRRIPVGPIVTLTFENTDTMRFQVQEMARAERMMRDEQIAHEVETYNQLVPDDGELSATLFIELTSKPALMEWLPKLVGIQRAVRFEVGEPAVIVPSIPQDEERLTREEVTPSVHYVKFAFDPDRARALRDGPARLVIDLPSYHEVTDLTDDQRTELAGDLVPA